MIGATTSQTLDLTLINKGDTIYGTSTIKLEIGLKIGSTTEYIPIGIYNIDDVEKNDYTVKITAYDNMIKFERNFATTLGDTLTLQQVVSELARITGVQFTGSLPSYNVKNLEGFSCREVLGYVASICGGNAVITRDGKFTIVTPKEVSYSIGTENYFDYNREETKYKIGKISCQVGEEVLSKGSLGTDSMELEFENPWINESILQDIYNKINGFEYLGYSMKWQGDLSLDVGDIITITDKKGVVRKQPILSQKFTYTGGLTSEIGAKGESKNKNSFSSSGSTAKKVDRVVAELLIVNEALIEKANIQDLEAVSIRTQTLEAKTATIEEAIINVAHIEDLNAINATIENLKVVDLAAINAKITKLQADKANITDLTATNIKFNVASGGTLDLQTLLAKHITGENGQYLNITASNTVIANAVIKDAMIENISVNKLLAGTISTNKFTVASDDGGIQIVGPTMQFKDKNNKVRIQMGQDTQGGFNFILRGEDGTTTLIDHTGIKEKAIADDLIKSNMVAADTIGEKQINYSSFVTGLNKDTNTSLIKASKVAIDLTGQSLEVAFNSLKANVDNMEISGRNLFIVKDSSYVYIDSNGNEVPSIYDIITSDYIEIENINYVTTLWKEPKDGDTYIVYSFFDKNKKFISRILHNSNPSYLKSENIPSNATTFRIWARWIKNGKIKIEKGDKSTDWTPALEDIDSKIESNTTAITVAQGKIEGLISENSIIRGDITTISDKYTSLKATVDGINTTVASHSSNIGTINTNISGLDGKITTVENKYSSLNQDLTGFKTTVSNTYSTKTEVSNLSGTVSSINSRVSTAESSITQLNNKITQKVEATEVNTIVNNAINNVQIGGRNLIKDSNNIFLIGSDYPNVTNRENGKITVITSGKFNAYKFIQSNMSVNLLSITNITGKKFTMSVDVRTTNLNVDDIRVYFDFRGTGKKTSESYAVLDKNKNGIWYRVSASFEIIDTEYSNCLLTISSTRSSVVSDCTGLIIEYKNWKLEEGNKATDYTVAPEDIGSSISNVSNKVATIETNLNSITSRVSSTESNITTINSNVSSLQSRMSSAEQKITDNAIISTVQDTITQAKNDAISSANSATDSKLKNYATTSAMESAISQKANEISLSISNTYLSKTDAVNTYATKSSLTLTENSLVAKFSSSGGYNIVKNSGFKNGGVGWGLGEYNPNGTGRNYEIWNDTSEWILDGTYALCMRSTNQTSGEFRVDSQKFKVKRNTTYTLSYLVAAHRVTKIGHYIRGNEWGIIDSRGYQPNGGGKNRNDWTRIVHTFNTGDNYQISLNFIHFQTGSDAYSWITDVMINEGDVALPWTPHPDEVYSGSTMIDANGVTIYNGALTVKNNAGQIMLKGDSNGDLTFCGKLQPNDYQIKLFGNECKIDGSKGAIRVQLTSQIYTAIDEQGGFRIYNQYSNGGTKYTSIMMGSDNHVSLYNDRTRLKILGGDTPQVQARNTGDNAYVSMAASQFINASSAEYKTSIEDADLDFIKILKENSIKKYKFKEEVERLNREMLLAGENAEKYASHKIGFILEELTEEARMYLNPNNTDGIDTYSMCALLWGIVKEQQNRIEKLEMLI